MRIYENLSLENLDGEEWKKIDEYEDYQVSNFGRVKSFKKWHKIDCIILKQQKNNKTGYLQVNLYKNKKRCSGIKIHILLFETFNNYKLKKDECVHHTDFIKENNYFDNLIMMSKKEHDSFHMKGKNNPNFGNTFQKNTEEK